jgi:hypothetical protein
MVFLGTQGSLTLLGTTLSVGAENLRESYKYSIDSWPVKLQEQFMNDGDHRAESNPPLRLEGTVNYREQGPDATVLHMAEFLDCVRSRKPCSESAEVGHFAAAAGHMVNLSYRSGKRMVWDAASGTAKQA